jgi:hypothetical protein
VAFPSSPSQTILITSPALPILPHISITSPNEIGTCISPILDIFGSTGSCGRPWSRVTVEVFKKDSSLEPLPAINSFFQSPSYLSNYRTPIPSSLIPPNSSLLFIVTLCNFFGSCSNGTHAMRVGDTPQPVVTILGPSSRSILNNQSFFLTTSVTYPTCQHEVGEGMPSRVNYLWRIFKNNTLDSSMRSISSSSSSDPSKFKLKPFSFDPRFLYEVVVTVSTSLDFMTAAASNTSIALQTSTARVFVRILPSDLIPIVTGGDIQNVRSGEVLMIDASASYDSYSRGTNFSFVWECQSSSSPCGVTLQPINLRQSIISVTPIAPPTGATGGATNTSVSLITLSLIDGLGPSYRKSLKVIQINILPPTSPSVSIQSITSTTLNPSNAVLLTGHIRTFSTISASWVLQDPSQRSVELKPIALTLVSKTLFPGDNSFNLMISPGTLTAGSPYTFRLTAAAAVGGQDVQSTLAITINSPPVDGTLSVNPRNGIAMTTQFEFLALDWIDDHLPLTFEFRYATTTTMTTGNSNSGSSSKVLKARSEVYFTSSFLPFGDPQKNNSVVCLVRVFDVLDAFSQTNVSSVHVRRDDGNNTNTVWISNLQQTLSAAVSLEGGGSGGGDLDVIKQTLSLATSMLNQKDCTRAPNCTALSRGNCFLIDHTCGECLDGYFGQTGPANTLCLDSYNRTSLTQQQTPSLPLLGSLSKVCLNNCSGHGQCQYQDTSSDGRPDTPAPVVEHCGVYDVTCEAICQCDEGYFGQFCQMTFQEIRNRQEFRLSSLSALAIVTSTDDATTDRMDSWIELLSSITQHTDELPSEASEFSLAIATSILNFTFSMSTSSSRLPFQMLLASVDHGLAAGMSSTPSSSSRRLQQSKNISQFRDLLDVYARYQASQILLGQSSSSLDSIHETFRVTSNAFQFSSSSWDTDLHEIRTPLSPQESMFGLLPSSCFVNISSGGSGSDLDSFSVTLASLSGDHLTSSNSMSPLSPSAGNETLGSNLLTNSLRVNILLTPPSSSAASSPTPSLPPLHEVILTLQHRHPQVEELYQHPISGGEVFNITCAPGDDTSHVIMCPTSAGQHNGTISMTHTCDGSSSLAHTETIICPLVHLRPTCRVVTGEENFNCTVIHFNSSSTTCSCRPLTSSSLSSSSHLRTLTSSSSSVLSDFTSLEVRPLPSGSLVTTAPCRWWLLQ